MSPSPTSSRLLSCLGRFLLTGMGLLLLTTPANGQFQLSDGDRVVLLGNTLIEREQRYGYWETALTARFPGRKITFRNLGWSGDTVFGHARAGFGNVADGFRHLKEHTLALKPTVLLIGYGTNESFDGPEGLPRFIKGYETLLDALAPTKARLVLLSPLRQEDPGRPLPDPTAQNKNLRLYADAIRDLAKKRGAVFVDLYEPLVYAWRGMPAAPLTDNGIHPTAWGYWKSALVLERGLRPRDEQVQIEVGPTVSARGATVTQVERAKDRLTFRLRLDTLPPPPPPGAGSPPGGSFAWPWTVSISGLPEGMWAWRIDGQEIMTPTQRVWRRGSHPQRGPDYEQAEKLRQAIVAKNELYFHRWRPQNETYLFGFRKHEQGKNAREIPLFDPLVAEKEAEIAKLAVPIERKWELKRVEK
jgi:lysophospholipase L1-like esterase